MTLNSSSLLQYLSWRVAVLLQQHRRQLFLFAYSLFFPPQRLLPGIFRFEYFFREQTAVFNVF
jgi:hypothetical protein